MFISEGLHFLHVHSEICGPYVNEERDGAVGKLTRHEVLLQQGPSLQWAPLEREHFLQHSP